MLNKIKHFLVNPNIYKSIYIDGESFWTILYSSDYQLAKAEFINIGIIKALSNNQNYDRNFWFNKDMGLDVLDGLCQEFINFHTNPANRYRSGQNPYLKLLRIFFKYLKVADGSLLQATDIRLKDQDLIDWINRYAIKKESHIVKVINENIEHAFELFYNNGFTRVEFEEKIFHKIFCNKYEQGYYDKIGEECCNYIRSELMINYNVMFGNVEYPIYNILEDENKIIHDRFIYSAKHGLLCLNTFFDRGLINKKYWKMTDQEQEILNMQLCYLITYLLKIPVKEMIILHINTSLKFNYKIEKISLNINDYLPELNSLLDEITNYA